MRSIHVTGVGFALFGMAIGATGEARAQGGWTDAGTDVHLTTGSDRMGIGTRAPAAKLHVTGNVRVDGRVITDRLAAPDTSALHLTVGGQRALRLAPTTGNPNIIGGSRVNEVDPTVVGATIAGGGAATLPGHAMKATPVIVSGIALYPTGTILGKAMGALDMGTGVIKVLITLK